MKIKHSTTAVDDIIFELTQSERMVELIRDAILVQFKEDEFANITVDEEEQADLIIDDIINKFERA